MKSLVVEELAHVGVVRAVHERQVPAVLKVGDELAGCVFAENFERRGHLLLPDLLVLLLLGVRPHSLPGKRPLDEVHQHVAHSLKVIPSRLLDSQNGF